VPLDIVAPPPGTQLPYGLFSVVDWREDTGHWRQGIEYQTVCGGSGSTYVYCTASAPAVTGEPAAKTATATLSMRGATPFTVLTQVDCSAVGFFDQAYDIAEKVHNETSQFRVEEIFWTGTAGGVANAALPHLAASTGINGTQFTNTILLQPAYTAVTGTATSMQYALGALEQALARCLNGRQGVIHMPLNLVTLGANLGMIKPVGGRLQTLNGNWVVAGAGYPGTGPSGEPQVLGGGWMYGTGPLFGYRGPIQRVGEGDQILNRSTNLVQPRVERTFLLGFECCLYAIQVTG
jgi:hypothetical protein